MNGINSISCQKHIYEKTLAAMLCVGAFWSIGMAAQARPGKVRMVEGAEVVLTESWLTRREEFNTKYLMSLDNNRLLHNFRRLAGLPTSARPLGGWEHPGCGLRGHFTGHCLSALATLVQRYHDPRAERKLNELVDGLAECQSKFGNGYLGAIPESDFDTLERTYGNVWAPYYTLHKLLQGLVDAYLKAGNEKALKVASKAADYVYGRLEKLSPKTLEGMFRTDQANPSNEHGGMNEVLEQLYGITHDEKHLAAAKRFDRDWFVEPLAAHLDRLSGLHANTHIVLVGGFVRRYENTLEQRFHDAALNFWDLLMSGHVYANGTSSGPRPVATTACSRTAEHWGDAGKLANTLSANIAESCVTHNTQRLNAYLFQWTADAKYAEAALNMFYNATLACQNAGNGRVTYHLPLGSPRHKQWLGEEDFRCCNGSGIEAFAALNRNLYYVDDDSVYVVNYVPSEMTWKERGIKLVQSGGFPFTSSARLTVKGSAGRPFTLNLLIPSWVQDVTVSVNGEKRETIARAGKFLSLDRKWRDGDQVRLDFKYPFHLKSMPDNADKVVLFHGPLMLAFLDDGYIELPETGAELLSAIGGSPTEGYRLKSTAGEYRLKPLCQVVDERYSCYVMTNVRTTRSLIVDQVVIGDRENEHRHALKHSPHSHTGVFNGRHYRDSEPGGFVQYTLRNADGKAENAVLMLCLTLADKGRVASVYVDGVKVTDLVVPNTDGKGFYLLELPLPASVLKDGSGRVKPTLDIKFVASGPTQIPGLYDVHLLRRAK